MLPNLPDSLPPHVNNRKRRGHCPKWKKKRKRDIIGEKLKKQCLEWMICQRFYFRSFQSVGLVLVQGCVNSKNFATEIIEYMRTFQAAVLENSRMFQKNGQKIGGWSAVTLQSSSDLSLKASSCCWKNSAAVSCISKVLQLSICLFKYDFKAKVFPQISQECSFSVVWRCICARKFDLSPKLLPQWAQP